MTNDKHKLGCKREAKDIGMREKWKMINDHGLKSRQKMNFVSQYHPIDMDSAGMMVNICDYDWFFFLITY